MSRRPRRGRQTVVIKLLLQGQLEPSDRLRPSRRRETVVNESSACQLRAVSMRSGLTPAALARAWRCAHPPSSSCSRGFQSSIITPKKANLVIYVIEVWRF